MKFYKVWLINEYFERIDMFDKIEACELEDWLFKWASLEDGTWWLDGTSGAVIDALGIPVNAMGYIVKFEKI